MKIRLFLDEDVHSGLAHALRKRGYHEMHEDYIMWHHRTDAVEMESFPHHKHVEQFGRGYESYSKKDLPKVSNRVIRKIRAKRMKHEDLTSKIIACAYKVHNTLGFGLLINFAESVQIKRKILSRPQ